MSESERTTKEPQRDSYDEPFFEAVTELPRAEALPEPVFEAVPAQTRGVSLPVDAVYSQVGWETPTPSDSVVPRRRLGRTPPLWIGVAVLGAVALVAFWFLLDRPVADEPELPGEPASGVVVGSVLLNSSDAPTVAPSATATAEPQTARLSAGLRVAVGNTKGQGIRLRSAPSTNSLTLGIYNDGASFLVLPPGGDYGDYPVEADGYFWYRIRVIEDPADQLVGWAVGDFLVISDQ